MSKIKLLDTVLQAVSALIMAVKSIIRFVGYICKIWHQPATGTT